MISHCKNTLAYMCTHVGDRLIHPILCFSALKRVAWFQGVFDVVEDFCGSLEFVTTSFFVCTYVCTYFCVSLEPLLCEVCADVFDLRT